MGRFKLFIPLGIFVVLAVFFWRGLSLDPTYMPSALIDKPMPAFTLTTIEDGAETVTRDELLGKVSLLNVWATWCFACKAEHGELLAIAKLGVLIYGINYKDDRSEAEKWLEKLGNPYVFNIADEEGRLGLDLGVFGAPETYVLDKTGIIRYRHVGAITPQVWETVLKPIVEDLAKR